MDFVDQTTKIAARILKDVYAQHSHLMQEKIADEMKEFFDTTLFRAEALVDHLRSKYSEGGPSNAEVETHLRDIAQETLDRFRAEGSEEGNMRHFGHEVGDGIAEPGTPAPEIAAPYSAVEESPDVAPPPPELGNDPDAASPLVHGDNIPYDSPPVDNTDPNAPSLEKGPVGSQLEVEFDDIGDQELIDVADGDEDLMLGTVEEPEASFARDEIDTAPGHEPDIDINEDGFFANVDPAAQETADSGLTAIEPLEEPEPVSQEAPPVLDNGIEVQVSEVEAMPPEPPLDVPLSAEKAESEARAPEPQPPAPKPEAPAPKPQAPAPKPQAAAPAPQAAAPAPQAAEANADEPALPGPFNLLMDDPQKLKKALALMVKNGLMDRDEARKLYMRSLGK